MDCPNCHQKNIPALATKCPNCATNLVVYKKLVAIEEKYVETAKDVVDLEGKLLQNQKEYERQIGRKNRWNFFLWLWLLALGLWFYFYSQPLSKSILLQSAKKQDSINVLNNKLDAQQIQLADLAKKYQAAQSAKVVRELKYVVKEGDVLHELGLLFYNDSTAWYQIALDNNIYDIRGLPIGDTLTIRYKE